MSVVISGSGISGPDGSAASPSYEGTDTDTGIFFPSAGIIGFSTDGTERVRVAANGNIGIGTTTPANRLDVAGTAQVDYLIIDPQNAATGEGGELQLRAANTSFSDINFDNFFGNCRLHTLAAGKYFETIGGGIKSGVGLGVGTDPSTTTGEIRATNNITAYFSDIRLKTIIRSIENPVEKVCKLSGVIYTNNDVAKSFGYTSSDEQVGVIAQQVEEILPQVIKLAPFDTTYVDGIERSISGENYKTVQYEKLIPLLIEAIKEQQQQIEELKSLIANK